MEGLVEFSLNRTAMQPISDLTDDLVLTPQIAMRAKWAATIVAYRFAAMDDQQRVFSLQLGDRRKRGANATVVGMVNEEEGGGNT